MIKCKEDLINTVVFCPHGELRDLYIQKCKEFGIEWNHHNLNIDNYSLLYIDHAGNLQGVITEVDDCYEPVKLLTLEDLNPTVSPGTRITYEKVMEPIFDLREEFESGKLYFDKDQCSHRVFVSQSRYLEVKDLFDLSQAVLDSNLYRKVETPMDWKEILVEILPAGHGVVYSSIPCHINIEGCYNKGQAKVLAEGILKAIDESGEGN